MPPQGEGVLPVASARLSAFWAQSTPQASEQRRNSALVPFPRRRQGCCPVPGFRRSWAWWMQQKLNKHCLPHRSVLPTTSHGHSCLCIITLAISGAYILLDHFFKWTIDGSSLAGEGGAVPRGLPRRWRATGTPPRWCIHPHVVTAKRRATLPQGNYSADAKTMCLIVMACYISGPELPPCILLILINEYVIWLLELVIY